MKKMSLDEAQGFLQVIATAFISQQPNYQRFKIREEWNYYVAMDPNTGEKYKFSAKEENKSVYFYIEKIVYDEPELIEKIEAIDE